MPLFLKKGSFVFFAIDNSDFAEYTPDGKGTTHRTITAVYQKASASGAPIAPPLHVTEVQNLSVTPYHVPMMQCSKPKFRSNVASSDREDEEQFSVDQDGVDKSYQLTHFG